MQIEMQIEHGPGRERDTAGETKNKIFDRGAQSKTVAQSGQG